MSPLRPSHDNRLAPVLCLRHRQNPQARPPAPKLPQPWVDLIHVAPPTAIYSDCVSDSELKRAGLEVQQLVRYGRSRIALQETGKEWHRSKHKISGGNVQDRSGGRLVLLCGGMIHGPDSRPVAGNLSSSKVLKNTRLASMSSRPRVQVAFWEGLPLRGRKRHLKNNEGAHSTRHPRTYHMDLPG